MALQCEVYILNFKPSKFRGPLPCEKNCEVNWAWVYNVKFTTIYIKKRSIASEPDAVRRLPVAHQLSLHETLFLLFGGSGVWTFGGCTSFWQPLSIVLRSDGFLVMLTNRLRTVCNTKRRLIKWPLSQSRFASVQFWFIQRPLYYASCDLSLYELFWPTQFRSMLSGLKDRIQRVSKENACMHAEDSLLKILYWRNNKVAGLANQRKAIESLAKRLMPRNMVIAGECINRNSKKSLLKSCAR